MRRIVRDEDTGYLTSYMIAIKIDLLLSLETHVFNKCSKRFDYLTQVVDTKGKHYRSILVAFYFHDVNHDIYEANISSKYDCLV